MTAGTGQPVVAAPGPALADRVVVVTGASRGVGRDLARVFADHGARLGLLARSRDALDDLGGTLTAAGADVLAVPCDVGEPDSLAGAVDAVAAHFGGIDSVVVNAGISPVARRAHHLPIDAWHDVLATNLTGGFVTARAAYPHLARSGRGRLVFTTSVMAATPRRGLSAYAASKAGLEGLTRALAADWAGDGILVNAVAPGFFDTGLGAAFHTSQRLHEQVVGRTPVARFGRADELAAAFVFLAGDACGYLTGQVLAVDGGYGLG
ncbi:SDR family NAD(P)-dependent oxidoreductase [Polymorphospora rubra]|uniref:SDR family NAD(P)-dependent oxidoreductase n=1 Tax=Polymorphospora rubra TaxID=338584 RepID=UPI0033C873C0